MHKTENSSVVEEIIGCYGKVLVAKVTNGCQVVYMVTIPKPESVPVEYRLKVQNLDVVAKEINHCYGKILVAMVTNIQQRKN